MPEDLQQLRIGEFARRVGVAPDLIRAWERRYGLLAPVRSPGGFRLYTTADAIRVARMRRALDEGLSAAEAARFALQSEAGAWTAGQPADIAGRLLKAIEQYDEPAAHAVLDESFAAFGLEGLLREVILPVLTQVGLGWMNGRDAAISQEHFATHLIRGRLLSLARLWSRGDGPLTVLACAPGEAHDITLLAFGLLLRSHGLRILFLGANTPISTLTQTAEHTRPAMIVLASFTPGPLRAQASALAELARLARLVLAGPGASEALCARLGLERLDGDLISAAHDLARRPDR
jgi:DNA-binding transcriptional MerR regulator